jgi:hypothetical protein
LGGSSATGGAGGSTSAGTAGTGGEGGASGSSGAGGTSGDPDAASDGAGVSDSAGADGARDAPPTNEGGEAGDCLPAGTLTVVNQGSEGYLIDGGSLNAAITLCRGNKYALAIDSPGHPFYVRTSTGSTFTDGITGNHISSGDLVFDVPLSAPNLLFYQCDIHDVMTGAILIVD